MARPVISLVGKVFGRLTVLEYAGSRSKWICRCSCGSLVTVYNTSLRSGDTVSCGCYHSEKTKERESKAREDLTGASNFLLSYVSESGYDKRGNRLIKVRCQCGTEKDIDAARFMSGKIRSCGCYRKALSKTLIEKTRSPK